MMNEMIEHCGAGMWAMGLFGLLFIVLLVLGVAALTKYLFFSRSRTTG